jgi:hypothetical protein
MVVFYLVKIWYLLLYKKLQEEYSLPAFCKCGMNFAIEIFPKYDIIIIMMK